VTQQLRIRGAAIFLLAAGAIAAGDLPYAGKWKMNQAKSDFKGTTMTYSQTATGEMEYNADGLSYKFKTDGKEYPAVFGMTATWKQIDPVTFETVDKMNGKVISTDTTKISADGKSMTVESKGTKPNGESFDDTVAFQRVSGGPGMAGKWKTAQVKVGSPGVMEFSAAGSDGLTLTLSDYQATCTAKFDGKDYPATGPQVPPGFTLAIRKTGARSFEMIEKDHGKDLYKVEYTVSADGKTLTEIGGATATNEKIKVVYDRQ